MTYKTPLTANLASAQENASQKRNTQVASPRYNPRSQAQAHRLSSAADSVDGPNVSAPAFNALKSLYRIYTEDTSVDVTPIIKRYFEGATVYRGLGLDSRTQAADEKCIIIEIVSSAPDALQNALNLAGDLRIVLRQISVLVTVQDIRTFEVAEIPLRELGSKA